MSTKTKWVTAPEHPGYRVKTLTVGECTIQVLRPILEEREQKKREAQVTTVAERVMRDYYKRKEKRK